MFVVCAIDHWFYIVDLPISSDRDKINNHIKKCGRTYFKGILKGFFFFLNDFGSSYLFFFSEFYILKR